MKRLWVPLLAVLFLFPAAASARKVDLGDAPVIRKPLEWREGRFSVSPVLGVTIGDPYYTSMLVGASGDYHILDWLAVGLDFRYAVGFTSGLLDQIESDLSDARGQTAPVTASRLNWLVTANVQFVPIYGKFLLFDSWEVAYDMHLLVGVGYAGTITDPNDDTSRQIESRTDGSIAPVAGFGFRFFVNSWFGLNLEFRDYIVQMVRVVPEYPTGQDTPGRSFENNFSLSLGFTFLFPTEIENAEQ